MAYTAFYRTWRPQTFEQVVGQEHITRVLQNAVLNERVAHAYLFCGPRGTGKTSTARILAKAVNCQGGNSRPCNVCSCCLAVNDGSSLDVLEIDAASNRGIEEIKALRERIKFSPSSGRYRIYIIDEVHMLSHDAFNAFLKTLEEPPSHVIFILATTEANKVPLTVLSRCQRFDFRRISEQDIKDRLEQIASGAGLSVEGQALSLIARAAEGGLRDALSILDQAAATGEKNLTARYIHDLLGTVGEDLMEITAGHLAAGRVAELMKIVAELEDRGKELKIFCRDLTAYLRQLLLAAIEKGESGGSSQKRLWYTLHMLVEAEQNMRWSNQPGLVLELALIRATHPEWGELPDELSRRISELEERIISLPAQPVAAPAQPAVPAPAPAGSREKKESQSTAGKEEKQEAHGDQLAIVTGQWPRILQILRSKKPLLYSYLKKARPFKVEGEVLTLVFAREDDFLRESFGQGDNAVFLARLLSAQIQGSWRIATILDETSRAKIKPEREDLGHCLNTLFDASLVEGPGEKKTIERKG